MQSCLSTDGSCIRRTGHPFAVKMVDGASMLATSPVTRGSAGFCLGRRAFWAFASLMLA